MSDSGTQLNENKRAKPKPSRTKRFLRWVMIFFVALTIVAAAALGGLYWRLQSGPLRFSGLSERVVSTLSSYFSPDWKVRLADSAFELDEGAFALRVRGLEIANELGRLQLRAPDTVISIDTFSLLVGRLNPRTIEFIDLQVIGTVNDDGSVTFVPAESSLEETKDGEQLQRTEKLIADTTPDGLIPEQNPYQRQSRISHGVESFLEIIAGVKGPLGMLKRAELTNLRLILVDTSQRVRAHFNRIDANFERTSGKGRSFAATLRGARGSWFLKGDVQRLEAGYQIKSHIGEAPVQDILFLSGLSTLPFSTTLKVSGQVDALMVGGVLEHFDTTFKTGAGRLDVHDKDATPLYVDSSNVSTSWHEAGRKLSINQLEFTAGDSHFLLSGTANLRYGEPWRLQLAAENAVLSGVSADDTAIKVDQFDADIVGNGGITVNRLFFKGPDLEALIKAQYGLGDDPKAIAVEAQVSQTMLRSVLRLWPEIVASAPRRYLVKSLMDGKVRNGLVKVVLSGDDVKKAMHGGSVPDESLLVELDVENGAFLPTPGLPTLANAAVQTRVTGRSATVAAQDANIQLEKDRVISLPKISFHISDFWPKDSIGLIEAEAEGGADALVSFLSLPKIQETLSWNISADDIKGKMNLGIEIKLAINDIPSFADLPISVQGQLSEITLNNVIGTENLEKGRFTVHYDNGALDLRGDGQFAGHGASVVITQDEDGKGYGNFTFSLDEAARARRGVDFAGKLTGIMPFKVTLPLGKNSSDIYQIESDWTKVTINNLLPGWTKASGKKGKLALSAQKTDTGFEIRDLQLDAGIKVTGKAFLDKQGGFQNADLSKVQFSQGDDLQVKVDKNNDLFKIVIRGNVGDARPIIRSFTDGVGKKTASSGRESAGSSGSNADLDIALNILTGFNGETITKSSLKAGIRAGSLRQFQMTGRLGSSDVMAQTMAKANATQLNIQAGNAGSFLRYLDIYRRMYGGDIIFDMMLGNGGQNGSVMLREFAIRNEPALKRIVPSQTQGTGDRRIDVNDVGFTKARVDFFRNGSRVDFRDAAIWGTQVGLTFDGYLNFNSNQLDVSGTFVPAYGLNNAFAQVPLLGPILGGGQYGGLFGVNFRLTGVIGSPVVTVNPLSAVAPGIFRKLFGAGGPNLQDMPAQ